MKYRIHWKSKITDAEGQGAGTFDIKSAQQYADELNREWPDLIHWLEPVKEEDKHVHHPHPLG